MSLLVVLVALYSFVLFLSQMQLMLSTKLKPHVIV